MLTMPVLQHLWLSSLAFGLFRWLFLISFLLIALAGGVAFSSLGLQRDATFKHRHPLWVPRVRATGYLCLALFLSAILVTAAYSFIYEPLKFQYLIRQVESAQNAEQERAAFASAARWGHVWELNHLTKRGWWPEDKRHLRGPWLLELEWLECSSWTGRPYRAYRIVMDTNNLEVMTRRTQ